jgi:hypothetical protein
MVTTADSESLAALAAQLADLRGKVAYMQARLDRAGLDGSLDLPAKVAELAQTVAAALGEDQASRHTAPYWLDLPADVHAKKLAELDGWVRGVLVPNYPLALPSGCWAAHLDAVWELSTLREEWLRVYDRRYPELAGALAWHDRWLPGTSVRLAAILRDCPGGCVAQLAGGRYG